MTYYALVNPLNEVDRIDSNINPSVQTKPGWRWLPFFETPPVYDSNTQGLEGPVYDITPISVTRYRPVRDLTAQEIADRLDAKKEDELDKVLVVFNVLGKVLFNHENRIRSLEGKAPITANQFRAALKSML